MTDYSELVNRLLSPATVFYEYGADDGALLKDSAKAIEAQAKRIAELEAAGMSLVKLEIVNLSARIAELEAENAELERQIENYKVFLDGSENPEPESPF